MSKIMIVDDAAFMRLAIKNIVEKNGFEVVGEADNGLNAVKKYAEVSPDIVTMDITMPEVNGIEAVKNIMKMDPHAKIVMISAMGQETLVKEAVIAGAKSFIVKPFKEDIVVNTLKKLAGI